jgi:hypothetical protein
MTSGDEPMLPQPNDDNAPMISGRGTRVIADARGAYLAGNLTALIKHMDEAQQARFENAILRQSVTYAEWVARDDSAPESLPRRLNAAVLNWLEKREEQSWAVADALYREALPPHDLQNYEDLITAREAATMCLEVAVMEEMTLEWLARAIVQSADEYIGDADIWTAYRRNTPAWQIEAAWAILQGKEPPACEFAK